MRFPKNYSQGKFQIKVDIRFSANFHKTAVKSSFENEKIEWNSYSKIHKDSEVLLPLLDNNLHACHLIECGVSNLIYFVTIAFQKYLTSGKTQHCNILCNKYDILSVPSLPL